MAETHRLVLVEDLNQFGFLFGGRLLSWVDEASWIAASLDFPDCRFVTVGMDRVEFHHRVSAGDIISIRSKLEQKGSTSAGYRVEVYRGKCPEGEALFSTCVSFVNVDATGEKKKI